MRNSRVRIAGCFLISGMLVSPKFELLRNSSPRRGKNSRRSHLCRRAGATPRTFWAAEGRKSGVAPARFGVFSTVTLACAAFCIRLSSKELLAPQGEETGEDEGGLCSPYLLHPFLSGSCSGTDNQQSTSASKCTVARRSLPAKSWRMSDSVTRPTFHPR